MAVVFVLVIVSLIANAVADCSPSATTHNDDLYPIANQDYCRLYGNFGFGKTLDCSASPCNTSESFYTQWEVRSGQHWSWSADNNPGSQVNYTGSYRPHICVNENGSLILTSYDMSELLSWPVLIINMTCSKVIDNDNSSVPCSTHRFKFEVFQRSSPPGFFSSIQCSSNRQCSSITHDDHTIVKVRNYLMLCIEGNTFGALGNLSGIYWEHMSDLRVNVTEITHLNGHTCSDILQRYIKSSASHRDKRHAFIVFNRTHACRKVADRFTSVYWIPEVVISDAGQYKFYITSRDNYKAMSEFTVQTEFESLVSTTVSINVGQETQAICSLKYSVESSYGLKWLDNNENPIPVLNSSCFYTNNSAKEMCTCENESGIYSVQMNETLPEQGGVTLKEQTLILLVCQATMNMTSTFECISTNSNHTLATFNLTVLQVPSITQSPYLGNDRIPIIISSVITCFVTVFGALIILCMIYKTVKVCRRPRKVSISSVYSLPDDMWPQCAVLCDYDKDDSLEFPRDSLEFISLLGEGQFGQVWKAQAHGLVSSEPSRNIVAVKIVKEGGTMMDQDELFCELRIMKDILPHPNIMNLLGYCTQPAGSPVHLIMEYAAYGSLKDFLRKCQKSIQAKISHDSALSKTSTWSRTLTDYLSMQLRTDVVQDEHMCTCYTENETYLCMYKNLPDTSESRSVFRHHLSKPCSQQYYNQELVDTLAEPQSPGQCTCTCEDLIDVEDVEYKNMAPAECTCSSDYSSAVEKDVEYKNMAPGMCTCEYVDIAIEEHEKYKKCYCDCYTNQLDSQEHVPQHSPLQHQNYTLPDCGVDKELTSSDILNFALQIARAMEHLQRMKCIHRDLAARNILVAEGFLLKIADFGLARELINKDYYRKRSAGKVPARWMAIESLGSEKYHTHKSDVWSFGVVLWEIFTYAALPYGYSSVASSCESLLIHLQEGNRLEKPLRCDDAMYQLMKQCWDAEPSNRPSFSELVRVFDKLLTVAHGYLPVSPCSLSHHPSSHNSQDSSTPSPRQHSRTMRLTQDRSETEV